MQDMARPPDRTLPRAECYEALYSDEAVAVNIWMHPTECQDCLELPGGMMHETDHVTAPWTSWITSVKLPTGASPRNLARSASRDSAHVPIRGDANVLKKGCFTSA